MAKRIAKNFYLAANGVPLSHLVRSASIETERPEVDVTAMGDDFQTFLPGIGDASITVEFYMDYDAGGTYATLNPLAQSDTPFTLALRPSDAAISATNPEFQMQVLMYGWSPLAGAVNDAMTVEVTFRNASQAGLVADITP